MDTQFGGVVMGRHLKYNNTAMQGPISVQMLIEVPIKEEIAQVKKKGVQIRSCKYKVVAY